MARKPPVTAESLAAQIRESRKRWAKLHAHGGSDPFYRDGTNLNLVRSHILYDQDLLRSLCKEQKLKACPIEARLKPPKAVSEDFMAPGSKSGTYARPLPPKARRKRRQ